MRVSMRTGRIIPLPEFEHPDGIVPELWVGESSPLWPQCWGLSCPQQDRVICPWAAPARGSRALPTSCGGAALTSNLLPPMPKGRRMQWDTDSIQAHEALGHTLQLRV